MKQTKILLHVSIGNAEFNPTKKQINTIQKMVEAAVAKMGLDVGVLATNHTVDITPIYITHEES